MGVEEITFRRTSVHIVHDAKRLEHGEDLNDALLDFFVKLGQLLIPCGGLEGGFHSVAYLGSLFYDGLTSRGALDGRQGHANVANWARRRLGQGGLFFDGIGALAVPVNEMLGDAKGGKEKHWWLALLLNPRAGGKERSEAAERMALIYLDSYAHADLRCTPPVKVLMSGNSGYPLEVSGLSRKGVFANVYFKARGDGTAGALPDPKKSILTVGGREFCNPHVELTVDNRGDDGRPGRLEGHLEFALDSSVKISSESTLEFGGRGFYGGFPTLCVRRGLSSYQRQVSSFLAGYVAKEWEIADTGDATQRRAYSASQIMSEVRMPDVPQQETANDCGFFILEQILQALQLSAESLRTLAASSETLLAAMPWPSQQDVVRRKSRLKEGLEALFKAADEMGTQDVEVLLKEDQALRSQLQSAFWDGPRFADAARKLAIHSAPKQKFSIADLGAMSTKALRNLCAQHGALPPGTVDRPELLRALIPIVVDVEKIPKPEPSNSSAKAPPVVESAAAAAEKDGEAGSGVAPTLVTPARQSPEPQGQQKPAAEMHLSSLKFTVEDLGKLPLKTLRGLCIQHRVLPANAMERSDFVTALIPLASGQNGHKAGQGSSSAQVHESPAGQKRPASEMHLSALQFTIGDLGKLPLKTLKSLCIQHRVLPACAVERDDFVQALAPLATDGATGGAGDRKAKWQRVAAAGGHLGGLQFSEADLAAMPLKTLKGLCTQHKVLPSCAVERADFVKALLPFATGEPEVRPTESQSGGSAEEANGNQQAAQVCAETQMEDGEVVTEDKGAAG
jgi:hypothetical protein